MLVTNAISYLPQVDHIVVLDQGRITESGSYHQLMAKKGAFAEFLKNYLLEQEDDDNELLDEATKALNEEIMSHISLLIEDEFPSL